EEVEVMVREPVQVLEEQFQFLVRQPLAVPLVPHEGTIRAEGCPPRRRPRGGREGVERTGNNGAVLLATCARCVDGKSPNPERRLEAAASSWRRPAPGDPPAGRPEEHTSELQPREK